MTALAAAAAGLAVLLLVPGVPRLAPGGARPPGRIPVLAAGAVAVVVGLVRAPGAGVLLGLVAGVVVVGAALARRRAGDRAAGAVSLRVLETCELLAGELAAGQPPGRALRRAADAWPPLAPAAEAFDLGGDVPGVLRDLATRPGAGDLRLVAAAWAVAHRTGQGLAETVERCAGSIRGAQATGRVVRGELASARATARLVAALPVLALLMGTGAGGDPWGFLFGTPMGLACLAGGLAFGCAGLWWLEVIAGDVGADP